MKGELYEFYLWAKNLGHHESVAAVQAFKKLGPDERARMLKKWGYTRESAPPPPANQSCMCD